MFGIKNLMVSGTKNHGQKTIDIRSRTRYNIGNLIRKRCYHYRIFHVCNLRLRKFKVDMVAF